MKAVIVDIQGKNAAALAENGEVKKIPNDNYAIGNEVSLTEIIPIKHTPRPAAKIIRRVVVVAAALITLTALGFGTAYAVPSGTVSLDADPSIEYTINCFDYVLDVKALNDKGEEILSKLDDGQLKHHNVNDAVEATVTQIKKDGYLDTENAGVDINANTNDDNRSQYIQDNLNERLHTDLGVPLKDEKTENNEKQISNQAQDSQSQEAAPENNQKQDSKEKSVPNSDIGTNKLDQPDPNQQEAEDRPNESGENPAKNNKN